MNQYLDIIVFAVIAVVLLLRLRSVLGTRNDGEQEGPPLKLRTEADDAAQSSGMAEPAHLAAHGQKTMQTPNPERWAQLPPNFQLVETATVHNNLSQFLAVDPTFKPWDFLEKAKKAFSMIISAFAGGNRNTLEFLVAPELQSSFNALIDARETARETYHAEVHAIKQAQITGAELNGTTASVTVDISAEQSITHKDSEGRIINENDGHRRITKDRWVFEKDLKDPAPTWLLAKILPQED